MLNMTCSLFRVELLLSWLGDLSIICIVNTSFEKIDLE